MVTTSREAKKAVATEAEAVTQLVTMSADIVKNQAIYKKCATPAYRPEHQRSMRRASLTRTPTRWTKKTPPRPQQRNNIIITHGNNSNNHRLTGNHYKKFTWCLRILSNWWHCTQK